MLEVQINATKLCLLNSNYNLVPMKLTTEFSKVNAKIGETIELKCFVEGNPKPKISWQKLTGAKSESKELK